MRVSVQREKRGLASIDQPSYGEPAPRRRPWIKRLLGLIVASNNALQSTRTSMRVGQFVAAYCAGLAACAGFAFSPMWRSKKASSLV